MAPAPAPAPYLQHISTSLINSFIPHSEFFIFLSAKNIRNAKQRPAPSRENGKMRYFSPRTSRFPSASLLPCKRENRRSFGFKSNPNYERVFLMLLKLIHPIKSLYIPVHILKCAFLFPLSRLNLWRGSIRDSETGSAPC